VVESRKRSNRPKSQFTNHKWLLLEEAVTERNVGSVAVLALQGDFDAHRRKLS